MKTSSHTNFCVVVAVLVAGICAAAAGPNVPSSDLPGRERERFTPSPLDRFFQPNPPAEPLIRRECDDPGATRSKQRARRNRECAGR